MGWTHVSSRLKIGYAIKLAFLALIKIEDSDWVSAVHRVQRKTDDAGKEEIFDELLCHFFAKEITEEEYIALEREQLSAREWGKEVRKREFSK